MGDKKNRGLQDREIVCVWWWHNEISVWACKWWREWKTTSLKQLILPSAVALMSKLQTPLNTSRVWCGTTGRAGTRNKWMLVVCMFHILEALRCFIYIVSAPHCSSLHLFSTPSVYLSNTLICVAEPVSQSKPVPHWPCTFIRLPLPLLLLCLLWCVK